MERMEPPLVWLGLSLLSRSDKKEDESHQYNSLSGTAVFVWNECGQFDFRTTWSSIPSVVIDPLFLSNVFTTNDGRYPFVTHLVTWKWNRHWSDVSSIYRINLSDSFTIKDCGRCIGIWISRLWHMFWSTDHVRPNWCSCIAHISFFTTCAGIPSVTNHFIWS
jgi:hypothetical protein